VATAVDDAESFAATGWSIGGNVPLWQQGYYVFPMELCFKKQ